LGFFFSLLVYCPFFGDYYNLKTKKCPDRTAYKDKWGMNSIIITAISS
jgi:hypothetical protein